MNTEITQLVDKIKRYNTLYRMGVPEISDAEYDKLIDELKSLDPENDWFKDIEPATVPETRKRKLPIPMKSLNKAKNMADIKNWRSPMGLHDKIKVVCMPKFDGLSMLRNESTGESYTRGGSENEGQICTEHNFMIGESTQLSPLGFVFGEIVFSVEKWEKYFKGKVSPDTLLPYKSPRNTAAGFLNRDTPTPLLKHVDFYKYGVDEMSRVLYNTFTEIISDICEIYHQKPLFETVELGSLTEEYLCELYKKWRMEYYIDGIVIYVDDLKIWDLAGRHQSTGNPMYAIAYKHPDFTDSFETTVKDVVWGASKSGALKPVVNIEAVDTGDCQMENPTGYNAGWISNMQIAKGATVLVTRSGGVIPKILQTIKPATDEEQSGMWDNLAECPFCGAPTQWNESYVELCCTNPECNGRKLAEIIFFFNTCGVENMGDETFTKMFNAGFKTIGSMLNITSLDLFGIEGFGLHIANIIIDNFAKIKKGVDLFVLAHASNCFTGIGQIKMKKIWEEMSEDDRLAFQNKRLAPSGHPANKTMQCFEDGLGRFYRFVENNNLHIIVPEKQLVNTKGLFAGEKICFTGIRNAEAEALIIREGGNIVSGVSKNTTLLVVKDLSATSSKINKAQSLNIPIVSFEDFQKKLTDIG